MDSEHVRRSGIAWKRQRQRETVRLKFMGNLETPTSVEASVRRSGQTCERGTREQPACEAFRSRLKLESKQGLT